MSGIHFFRKAAVLPFILYKKIVSPLLPQACLYHPTCSEYAVQSILKFGIFRGIVLSFARILRCNGWFFTGGGDPVPEEFSWSAIKAAYQKYRK